MKALEFRKFSVLLGFVVFMIPLVLYAQPEQTASSRPPIASPLIREGTFAVKLVSGLGIATTDDEVEAENRLADVGILPRNGWIADYPATPDVIGELQQSVSDAASAGKISLGKDEALKRYRDALAQADLPIAPYSPQGTSEAGPAGSENYPNPSVINNYYYDEGPPVVTCYAPPPDFYYLYAWVPFPFWWFDFWFPGYFILHDFHRTVIVDRRVFFVSNHFRDVRVNRVFRVDPVARFNGRTFGGIGASRTRGLLSTGIPGSERRIFNSPPPRMAPGPMTVTPPSSRGGMVQPPSRSGGVSGAPSRSGGSFGGRGRGR